MRSIEIKFSMPSMPGKTPGRFSFISSPTKTASTLRQMVWDAREVTTALAEMASEFWSGILTRAEELAQAPEIQEGESPGYNTLSSHSQPIESDEQSPFVSDSSVHAASPTDSAPALEIRRMALEKARDTLFDLPEEVIPEYYIAILQGFDPTTGRHRLFIRCDEDAPAWLHLGMLDPITEDIRDALRD